MRFSSLFYASFTVIGILVVDYAHGQTAPVLPSTSAMSEIRVTAPASARTTLRLQEVAELRGTYALSNGWLLKVRPSARTMFAEIDDRGMVELRPLSPDKFVSLDGNMAMEFNLGADGRDMVLSYVPDPRLSQVVVVRTTLAAR